MAAFIFTSRSIGTIQKNNVCIHTLQYRASGIVLGGHVTVVQLPDQYTLIEQSSVCVCVCVSHLASSYHCISVKERFKVY